MQNVEIELGSYITSYMQKMQSVIAVHIASSLLMLGYIIIEEHECLQHNDGLLVKRYLVLFCSQAPLMAF